MSYGHLPFPTNPRARITRALTEGFNNKIRRLVRQACGHRDYKDFRLKVFDLPNIKLRDRDS